MAYPLEAQNKEYTDYAIEEQANGRQPLSHEEWMRLNMQLIKKQAMEQPQETMAGAIDSGLGYMPK